MVDVLSAIFKTLSMRLLLPQDNYFFLKIMSLYHKLFLKKFHHLHFSPLSWGVVRRGPPFFVPVLKIHNDIVDNISRTILPGGGIAEECIEGD